MGDSLRPCPFCACAHVSVDVEALEWLVLCEWCGARIPGFKSRKEAVDAWNKRG